MRFDGFSKISATPPAGERPAERLDRRLGEVEHVVEFVDGEVGDVEEVPHWCPTIELAEDRRDDADRFVDLGLA